MVSHMDPFNQFDQLNNYKPQNSKIKPKCMICNQDTARYAHCFKCKKLACFNNCLTLIIQPIYDKFPNWAKDPGLLGQRLCNNCLPPSNNNQANNNQIRTSSIDRLFAEIFGDTK